MSSVCSQAYEGNSEKWGGVVLRNSIMDLHGTTGEGKFDEKRIIMDMKEERVRVFDFCGNHK